MPALHQNKSRAEKAADQQAGKPFTARVAINNVVVFPSNGAAPADAERQQNITTSEKFDWLDAVMADHRIDTRAKVVAFCLMQHLNRETGIAFVSDATITDKTGMPNRWVRRARNHLRAAGWITWKRTRTANVYSTMTGPMAATAEQQRTLKEARDARRKSQVRPQVAEPELLQATDGNGDRPQVAEHDGPWVAEQVRPQVADIPLSVNPVVEPLSKNISAAIDSDFKNAASRNPSGSNSDFETFWQTYPKKVGRLQAEKKYNEIIKSKKASAADLLGGAGRYAAERARQDHQYTKHPITWLIGGHWTDEPQPTSGLGSQNRTDSAMDGLRSFLDGGHE
jgi:hypothetical protein